MKNNVCTTLQWNITDNVENDFLGTETTNYLVWLRYMRDIISHVMIHTNLKFTREKLKTYVDFLNVTVNLLNCNMKHIYTVSLLIVINFLISILFQLDYKLISWFQISNLNLTRTQKKDKFFIVKYCVLKDYSRPIPLLKIILNVYVVGLRKEKKIVGYQFK